jgi:hypothetical protein
MYNTDEVTKDLSESLARYYIDLSNRRSKGKALKTWQRHSWSYMRACKVIYERPDIVLRRNEAIKRVNLLLQAF